MASSARRAQPVSVAGEPLDLHSDQAHIVGEFSQCRELLNLRDYTLAEFGWREGAALRDRIRKAAIIVKLPITALDFEESVGEEQNNVV
jgi:hypothetical protein